MKEKESGPQDLELQKRLYTLMFLRVLFVSVILGALIIIRFRGTHAAITGPQTAPYLLLAAIYFTNIIYIFLIKSLGRIRLQAYFQLLFDTVFITGFIYTTGGVDSLFSFLFILNIISGGILFSRKGGILIASASSILYGLMLDLHYYGLIHPIGARTDFTSQSYNSAFLFYTILVNMAAFYLVGYLSGFLAEQTKKSQAELKETQLDLSKLEVLHESIIASITSGLIVLDDEERIILFNSTAEKILDVHSGQMSGMALASALPALQAHFQRAVKIRPSSNTHPFMDISYLKPNDAKIHLRLSISPLRYASTVKGGTILELQDVTELKRIEENMRKVEQLALVGEMAAGIAHEIRNPMASISGSIEILKEGSSWDSTQNKLMTIVSREVDRLNKLINDFLLFARPKKPKLRTFDLNRVVTESLELFKNSRHWNPNITVMKHYKDVLMIESDQDQIKQVLWNLFLNARDAIAAGGRLHITTRWSPESPGSNRGEVSIVIRDSGNGFNPKLLPKLFTPFFTTKEGGSGLGLATVKRIVDQLHGTVSGNNHPDGGAEVVIILPTVCGVYNKARR